jgi:hypothetical protein
MTNDDDGRDDALREQLAEDAQLLAEVETASAREWDEFDRSRIKGDVAQRVARGVAVLDAYHGTARWYRKIDLDTLSMAHGDRCVLGQLFGNYDRGEDSINTEWHELRVSSDPSRGFFSPNRHGFDVGASRRVWRSAYVEYALLNRLWAYVVRRRRALDAAAGSPAATS